MPFDFERTAIEDVVVVKPEVFVDERGIFLETFETSAFESVGIESDFVLEYYSESKQRVLRGLHQQAPPHQQAKLVRCFDGRIYDVAVDARPKSSTYGEYVARRISDEDKHAIFVPRGFLHGFVTLSERALVHYHVDNEYAPEHEVGVRWDDPTIGIDWPVSDPILSEKDSKWGTLQESIYARS
jgi:dTDP-4-dehydrorhamnose 3,5-epimerase